MFLVLPKTRGADNRARAVRVREVDATLCVGGSSASRCGRGKAERNLIYRLAETERDQWRRQHIGFVFQDFHLLPELSPILNVKIAATFSRPPKGIKERARELLDELGVPPGRQSIETLSRGERQRVAIARALLFDPPVILADEPTASLDDAATEQVLSALRALARRGKTVVMVSHEPTAIAEADQLVTLARGHIVEPGAAA